MAFDVTGARAVLVRTPAALDGLLRGLPEAWVRATEGGDSWSPFDIVGHLIHGDESDWISRARRILEEGDRRAFDPFNRTAMFEAHRGRTMDQLLDRFAEVRRVSVAALDALSLSAPDLARIGRHPAFGPVTLGQLLATWVAHDLDHVAQIARVMAKRYATDVGPWREYLPIVGT